MLSSAVARGRGQTLAGAHGWGNLAIAFRHKNYRTYQTGRFIGQFTSWMYRIAVGWLAWKLTHSFAWVGFFAFLDQAPALFIMPLAGALADRMDLLRFMRISQWCLFAQAILLAALDYLDLLTLTGLIVFTLAYGIIHAAQQPPAQAILPNLMPRDALTVAYGLNSVLFNVARFFGPMVAGWLISLWGTAPAIFANAVGAMIFLVCLVVMRSEFSLPAKPRTHGHNIFGDIRDGFNYAMKHEGIGPTIIILSTLSLMPFTIDNLLPGLADGVYHAGAPGLSWMTSIMALGAMMQAMLVARRGGVTGLANYAVGAIFWQAIGFFALAASGNIWLALVCIYVIGFASSATRVGSMTLLQYSVDLDMRARVASFYSLITHFVPALGALFVGALADRIGMQVTMAILGVWTMGVWVWANARKGVMAGALEIEAEAYRARAQREKTP
jgi:MFS family permease